LVYICICMYMYVMYTFKSEYLFRVSLLFEKTLL
jgi:hypothetical protein